MKSHTPGPWHFDGHGINSPTGERIAKVQHSSNYEEGPDGKPRRNARFDADSNLIAAAPVMLEALKAIADSEHCLTAYGVQGLRDLARNALSCLKDV